MEILSPNYRTEDEDPFGCNWEKLIEAEEGGNPTGRPAVSNKLYPHDLSETEPPTRWHIPLAVVCSYLMHIP